jgi:hypothetical protein
MALSSYLRWQEWLNTLPEYGHLTISEELSPSHHDLVAIEWKLLQRKCVWKWKYEPMSPCDIDFLGLVFKTWKVFNQFCTQLLEQHGLATANSAMQDVHWKVVLTQLDTECPVFIFTGIFTALSISEITQSDGSVIHKDEFDRIWKVSVAAWSR